MNAVLKELVLVNISLFFMQLIFFAMSMIIAVSLKKIRAVLPVSLGLVFIFYILNTMLIVGKDNGVIKIFYTIPILYTRRYSKVEQI